MPRDYIYSCLSFSLSLSIHIYIYNLIFICSFYIFLCAIDFIERPITREFVMCMGKGSLPPLPFLKAVAADFHRPSGRGPEGSPGLITFDHSLASRSKFHMSRFICSFAVKWHAQHNLIVGDVCVSFVLLHINRKIQYCYGDQSDKLCMWRFRNRLFDMFWNSYKRIEAHLQHN